MATPPVLTLFGDDSGSTGADLLRPEQPILVSCLILLSTEQEQRLQTAIADIRGEYPNLIVKELKFSKLGKTRMGLGAVRKIGLALKNVGARLFFSINEKRYFACHLLSETFFDAELNPLAPPEYLVPGYRRWLTNKIYGTVSDRLLAELLTAIRSDDEEGTRRVGESLVGLLRLHHDRRVSHAAELLAAGLTNFFRFGKKHPDAPSLSERPNPAVAEFAVLLSAIDQELAKQGAVARIVSDVDKQFGENINFSLELAKNPDCFDESGHSQYGTRGPCTQLLERTEVSSETSLGVQLADIGAGIVNRVAFDSCRGKEMDSTLMNAWEPFHRMAQMNPECTWWRVSEHSFKKLLKPFRGVCPPLDPV